MGVIVIGMRSRLLRINKGSTSVVPRYCVECPGRFGGMPLAVLYYINYLLHFVGEGMRTIGLTGSESSVHNGRDFGPR